ncbi:DNA cytosine methyltransferase [Microbacterium sp. APC 3898]|uniref:Cytosine-specific methyltransferase n=1 Tax=Planococcus notacanthi TaxID=3035188 RepID=A0ABT7ZQ06_9BACL|nr:MULTISPECIES: DNA cytosine methyltransferase [Terrabacteria group]MDN3429167.1 DNA cytosine methyltransferase [Planococcus sp. APC 4016]MDN3501058.1 DNA cytosine methyltransferase [Microbacterium sp. APC 3898]
MKKITHIDCFSGPGGICTGFKAAGLETILAIELVESCVDTYKANHKDVPIINQDISKVTKEEILNIIGDQEVDILSSGMPCETFSTAGATSRASYDGRQHLYREAIRVAGIVDAKMILFENVPGFQNKRISKESDRFILDDLYQDLEESGYRYHIKTVLNAMDFGVPQARNRFFVLASKEERNLKIPSPIEGEYISVSEALSDLPSVEHGLEYVGNEFTSDQTDYAALMKDKSFWKMDNDNEEVKLTYHIPPKHRPKSLERFSLIEQGEGLKNLFFKFPEEEVLRLQEEKILPKKWYIQRNRRLFGNKPAVTVTSHCLDELLHPIENRALTVREVARLQSFPDLYDFKGGPMVCPHNDARQDKYEQIGDAVPPLLAYHWGLTIKNILIEQVLEEVR